MILDKHIEVYKRDTTRNEYNEKVEILDHHLSLPAAVNYRGGREGFYARQVVATGEVTFTVRWIEGLDTTMMIVFDGKVHEITYIEPVGRMHTLLIHTKTVDNKKPPEDDNG